MTIFALLSLLVVLAAVFSLISARLLRLPATVGVMLLSLATSTALIIFGHSMPLVQGAVREMVGRIDFSQLVLHAMLAFLLFAGALQLNLGQLTREKLPVVVLSIFSTVVSTLLVGGILRLVIAPLHLHFGLIDCLLFGALISPTDPIAVLEMLRRVGVPLSLETQLAGESLFNDGVGAVLFLTLLQSSHQHGLPKLGSFTYLLCLKAGGGIFVGMAAGYLTYRLILLVDSYRVEVLLTLALAMGGYAIADALGFSAPLEAVAAGLMVGGRARSLAMSQNTRDHVDRFWETVDDLLNVVLFLLLGLELWAMPWSRAYLYAGLITIPVVLIARWWSVAAAIGMLHYWHKPIRGTTAILTWGGLRGGLAVALALSLRDGPARDATLAITYIVVIFSIVVQGLTMERLLRRLSARVLQAV